MGFLKKLFNFQTKDALELEMERTAIKLSELVRIHGIETEEERKWLQRLESLRLNFYDRKFRTPDAEILVDKLERQLNLENKRLERDVKAEVLSEKKIGELLEALEAHIFRKAA